MGKKHGTLTKSGKVAHTPSITRYSPYFRSGNKPQKLERNVRKNKSRKEPRVELGKESFSLEDMLMLLLFQTAESDLQTSMPVEEMPIWPDDHRQ